MYGEFKFRKLNKKIKLLMGRSLLKLTNYNLNQMKVAVGEGLEPSRSG